MVILTHFPDDSRKNLYYLADTPPKKGEVLKFKDRPPYKCDSVKVYESKTISLAIIELKFMKGETNANNHCSP